jgi:hypothetical protein
MLRFGGAVAPGVVISGELTGWSKQQNGGTESASWATAVVQWYPQPTQGFYVKAGTGVAALYGTGYAPGYGSVDLRTTNLGLEVGAGFDIRLSHGFSLTPYADFLYATGADAILNGTSTGLNLGGNLLHLGLAASWR